MTRRTPVATEVTTAPAAHTPARRPRLVALFGPAFVAAIAYVDPGNVAANLTAGARYGYLLLWVLVAANAMAVLVQYQSAKLGVVTGESLPGVLGRRMRRGPRLAFWAQGEVVAAATDLAEVVGGAIALHLLFGLPLVWGGAIVGVVSMLLLATQDRYGQRRFEAVVAALLLVIVIGFLCGLVVGPPDPSEMLAGLAPRFAGTDSVVLAASMLGATVMPHAIYVHSALSRDRFGSTADAPARHRLLRATRWDVVTALVVAGAVNIGLLLVAAANLRGVEGTDTIEGAHAAISSALGGGVGLVFAIGLLASGLASTSVGCYAGAAVMEGLIHRRIPLLVRRAITLVPALLLLGLGADPTWTLVVSQVVLSFGIPFAAIPLVRLNSDRRLMGEHVNGRGLQGVLILVVGLVVALNVVLLVLLATGA
ncbi:Nramp family divalent metal transporter [Cellulomonas denverensis]|uniref:Nramp family divalent metal transporter n=1 Tax=Cellulomonas denverensis TaxID=264297 RepID=A0A7X6KWC7_9CELL|nr:Nramp family divalent metal transporter [Cellulomonas denverensis]GIG25072.1 divalent metal cation transporter MntH [Cellulomonas denverensis]